MGRRLSSSRVHFPPEPADHRGDSAGLHRGGKGQDREWECRQGIQPELAPGTLSDWTFALVSRYSAGGTCCFLTPGMLGIQQVEVYREWTTRSIECHRQTRGQTHPYPSGLSRFPGTLAGERKIFPIQEPLRWHRGWGRSGGPCQVFQFTPLSSAVIICLQPARLQSAEQTRSEKKR